MSKIQKETQDDQMANNKGVDVNDVVVQLLELCNNLFKICEHGDFYHGIEMYGIDERHSRVCAINDLIKTYKKQYCEIKKVV